MFDFRMFDKFDRKFNQAKKFMSTNQVFAGLDTQGWSRPRPQRPEERPRTTTSDYFFRTRTPRCQSLIVKPKDGQTHTRAWTAIGKNRYRLRTRDARNELEILSWNSGRKMGPSCR